jgi:hypothetical protein
MRGQMLQRCLPFLFAALLATDPDVIRVGDYFRVTPERRPVRLVCVKRTVLLPGQ